MKKFAFCWIRYAVLLLFMSPVSASDTIRIATGEWPPWMSESLKKGGVITDIITEAFAAQDIDVDFMYFPWKRNMLEAKSGENVDAAAVWSRNAEREKDFIYSLPVFESKNVFMTRRDFPLRTWESMKDLRGLRMGATRSYYYSKAFNDAVKDGTLSVEIANTDKANLGKLLRGRIDLLPVDLHVGFYILQTEFSPENIHLVDYLEKPISQKSYHLIFPKKSERSVHFRDEFNQGLVRIKNNGKHDKLLNDSLEGKYHADK